MPEQSPTISIRLPMSTRKTLDKVAKATRRSRSYIMKEALDRYLPDIARDETKTQRKPLANLMSMAGIGAGLGPQRTGEEVVAHIRWLRDSD